MDQVYVVTFVIDSRRTAQKIADRALRNRLAASAHVPPWWSRVHSTFWWAGQLTREREYVVTLKTPAGRLAALMDFLHTVHPYDVPEIIAWPAQAGGEYQDWLRATTRAAETSAAGPEHPASDHH